MVKALITGITGQDGSYLADYLLQLGYQVYGLVRPAGHDERTSPRPIPPEVTTIAGDLRDIRSLENALERSAPDEVYNLAAVGLGPSAFTEPVAIAEVTALGTVRLLEAIRKVVPAARFFQASSSEMFGGGSGQPLNESSPFRPRNPYGAAKVYAHWMTVNFRETYGLFACCGILFNHESSRRREEFITRKITKAVARIKVGYQLELSLGNLEARRDWGYAGDYVQAMHLMLQQERHDDYVIATGESHSVAEFAECAFALVNLDWRDYVKVDPQLLRPTDTPHSVGDPTKAQQILGWRAATSFQELVGMMVRHDLADVGAMMENRAEVSS